MAAVAEAPEQAGGGCGGTNRQGDACGHSAGWGTKHVGYGQCKWHGGASPNGYKYAARLQREEVIAELRSESPYDLATLPSTPPEPTDAIMDALRVAAWKEASLRRRLIEDAAVEASHHSAVELLAKIAKAAADMGIDRRTVELAEYQADLVVMAIAAALDAIPGLAGAARTLAETAAARMLTSGAVPAMPVRVDVRAMAAIPVGPG